MAYRNRTYINKKMAAMRAAKEQKRLESQTEDRPPLLPELRRRIIIIDYDFGKTVHRIDLYKTDRIDCYRAETSGVTWKNKIGWAKVLEGIRKSFVRVKSL